MIDLRYFAKKYYISWNSMLLTKDTIDSKIILAYKSAFFNTSDLVSTLNLGNPKDNLLLNIVSLEDKFQELGGLVHSVMKLQHKYEIFIEPKDNYVEMDVTEYKKLDKVLVEFFDTLEKIRRSSNVVPICEEEKKEEALNPSLALDKKFKDIEDKMSSISKSVNDQIDSINKSVNEQIISELSSISKDLSNKVNSKLEDILSNLSIKLEQQSGNIKDVHEKEKQPITVAEEVIPVVEEVIPIVEEVIPAIIPVIETDVLVEPRSTANIKKDIEIDTVKVKVDIPVGKEDNSSKVEKSESINDKDFLLRHSLDDVDIALKDPYSDIDKESEDMLNSATIGADKVMPNIKEVEQVKKVSTLENLDCYDALSDNVLNYINSDFSDDRRDRFKDLVNKKVMTNNNL